MKHGILLTHGPVGDAMIEAVRHIMGLDDGLHALSVTDMSITEISSRLKSLVNAPDEQQDGVFIMASLRGGSCWNVAVGLAKEYPHIKVLSGVNLAMVLSFVTKRDQLSMDDLAIEVYQDGTRGICLLTPGKPC
jgi:PTS system mannose-specific IIA component